MSRQWRGAAQVPPRNGPPTTHAHQNGEPENDTRSVRARNLSRCIARTVQFAAAIAILVAGCILTVKVQDIGTPGASLSAAAFLVAAITLTAWVLSWGRR